MAIRIRFPREQPPSVDLLSYPLTELAMSLQVVASPSEHAALAPFVRRMRARMPRNVLRELRELAPLLGPPAPAPFGFPVGEPKSVPDALDEVLPSDEALHWTLSMFADEFSQVLPHTAEARVISREIERDADAVAERLLQLLRSYWAFAFCLEWPDTEARLALARVDAERQLAAGGVGSLLASSTRRARLSGHGTSVTPTI